MRLELASQTMSMPSRSSRSRVIQGESAGSPLLRIDGRSLAVMPTRPATQLSPLTMRSGRPVSRAQMAAKRLEISACGQLTRNGAPARDGPEATTRA